MFSIDLKEVGVGLVNYAQFEEKYVFDPQFEMDCVLAVLNNVCELLSRYPNLEFRCSGFDLKWTVDIKTDLSTIIEDLPITIENLRNLENASIDFFEQKNETEIVFFGFKEEHCFVKCLKTISGGRQVDIGTAEKLVLVDLIEELTVLLFNFVRVVRIYCPVLSSHPYFVKWIDSFRHLFV